MGLATHRRRHSNAPRARERDRTRRSRSASCVSQANCRDRSHPRRANCILAVTCSRDPIGYVDGSSLYRAHYIPSGVDPTGLSLAPCLEFDRQLSTTAPTCESVYKTCVELARRRADRCRETGYWFDCETRYRIEALLCYGKYRVCKAPKTPPGNPAPIPIPGVPEPYIPPWWGGDPGDDMPERPWDEPWTPEWERKIPETVPTRPPYYDAPIDDPRPGPIIPLPGPIIYPEILPRILPRIIPKIFPRIKPKTWNVPTW